MAIKINIPGITQHTAGNISYYLEKIEEERNAAKGNAATSATKPGSPSATSATTGANRKEQRKLEAAKRQQRTDILKPLQSELEQLEHHITEYETAQTTLTEYMSAPDTTGDAEKMQQASSAYLALTDKLEAAISRWGEVSDAIEKAETELA